jgi:hypothetical protein
VQGSHTDELRREAAASASAFDALFEQEQQGLARSLEHTVRGP